jgi:ketosteroid isomerase-like protein
MTANVLAANEAFNSAFSQLNGGAMEATWAHDGTVTIIHPISKEPLVGWDAVRGSWQGTLSRYKEVSINMPPSAVGIVGNAAWVIGVEDFKGVRPNGDKNEFRALTTNIFEKRDGRWLMVHHHGSRAP